ARERLGRIRRDPRQHRQPPSCDRRTGDRWPRGRAVTAEPALQTLATRAAAPSAATTRRIGTREFDFERQVAVMAVVNRTPDSFFDHGATFALDRAVAQALRAVEL